MATLWTVAVGGAEAAYKLAVNPAKTPGARLAPATSRAPCRRGAYGDVPKTRRANNERPARARIGV